jgi:predicted phosphodiesterase
MRVAALYDVHGNLPALEAVLDEVRREAVDLVVVGGDVVPGPMGRETLALLLDLDLPVRFLHGNGESAVLARRTGREAAVPEQAREIVRWQAGQLGENEARVLAGWPATLRIGVPGLGEVLFCHATPRDDTEIFTRGTADERLAPAFAGVDAPLVVCGHTHMPFDRTLGGTRIVNAGSVGMPFGAPGADWLLLGPGVEPRHTGYDLAAAADRIRATSYPGADRFAEGNVLHPPSEEAMLEAFAKVELL